MSYNNSVGSFRKKFQTSRKELDKNYNDNKEDDYNMLMFTS